MAEPQRKLGTTRPSSDTSVLLIAGVDGRGFEEDLVEAETRGVLARVVELPPPPPHLVDPAHFDLVADRIEAELAKHRGRCSRVAAIGRNAGGVHLAYCVARGAPCDAIVLTGAIPRVSTFFADSDHPVAVRIRALASAIPPRTLAPFDITNTLPRAGDTPCLIQMGSRDPWLQGAGTGELEKRFSVEWLDDDHAMVGAEAIARRWAFIERTLGPS